MLGCYLNGSSDVCCWNCVERQDACIRLLSVNHDSTISSLWHRPHSAIRVQLDRTWLLVASMPDTQHGATVRMQHADSNARARCTACGTCTLKLVSRCPSHYRKCSDPRYRACPSVVCVHTLPASLAINIEAQLMITAITQRGHRVCAFSRMCSLIDQRFAGDALLLLANVWGWPKLFGHINVGIGIGICLLKMVGNTMQHTYHIHMHTNPHTHTHRTWMRVHVILTHLDIMDANERTTVFYFPRVLLVCIDPSS